MAVFHIFPALSFKNHFPIIDCIDTKVKVQSEKKETKVELSKVKVQCLIEKQRAI